MYSETQLPLSLMENMNDDSSLAALRAWGADKSDETLGGALRVHALYDKQRAKYVRRLETMYKYFPGIFHCLRYINGLISRRELRRIVDEYKHKNPADTLWDNFTNENCSWQLVSHHLQETECEYQKVHGIRKASRAVGSTTFIGTLAEAIPEDDGLGLLKAGILIILKVCLAGVHLGICILWN